MNSSTAIVFNYIYTNRISYNVLSEALHMSCKNIKIYFEKFDVLKALLQITKEHKIVILAISIISTQKDELYKLMKEAKLSYPNITIIAGGPHATAAQDDVLNTGADIVVIGEGEKTFPELIYAIQQKEDYTKIKGIAYKNDMGEVVKTNSQELINLDDYPPYALTEKKFNMIEITRGCIHNCFFCCVTPQTKGKLRHRSVDDILKYVKIMCENDLPDTRFISSNSFAYGSVDGKTINYDAIEELLSKTKELIIKYEGKLFFGTFPSEVRPEMVNEKTMGLVKKYCDNDSIIIGAQSGSNRILKLCNRGHTIEDIYKAVELIKSAGILPCVDFIFGLPNETKEDQLETLKAIEKLIKMRARVHAHTFMPLEGTVFAKESYVKLDSKIEKELEKHVKSGWLYGDWKEQENFVKNSKNC